MAQTQTQDVNKIIDTINAEWAQDMALSKRKIAILAEENRLLKEELTKLQGEGDGVENGKTTD